ncbi:MAG: hypothetical protein JO027_05055 [Solirubrobacterales bacterium]|nr:hypothetical protein [Solirubrobacterales bacterium]
MRTRRLGALAALALAATLAGCGGSHTQHIPAVGDVPLVAGAKIAVQSRECDSGSSAFCAVDMVVVDGRYVSSDVLALDESHILAKHGWSLTHGDTGLQAAANSPGHKLRLTYTTAEGDLRDIDLGVINRPWPITYGLSSTMFDRAAAMSMMLEVGSS